jgi:hypothetical protein
MPTPQKSYQPKALTTLLSLKAGMPLAQAKAQGPIKLQSPAVKERYPSDSKTTGAISRGGMLYSRFQILRSASSSNVVVLLDFQHPAFGQSVSSAHNVKPTTTAEEAECLR